VFETRRSILHAAKMAHLRLAIGVVMLGLCRMANAQDLAPRAYIISPIHSNAVVTSYSFYTGNLDFGGGLPITDATATANVGSLSYFHSMRTFGRTANLTLVLPYAQANFKGSVLGTQTNVYRSGLVDSVYRFSVNLWGGPAMDPRQYVKWRQRTLLGASIRVMAPTGQYDSTKLINIGNNRWGFRPEVGLSRRWGHWVLDAYFGTWFYTTNQKFFSQNQYNPGIISQKQAPIGALEGHLSYDVKPRLWVSFDGNFWFGGKTSLNGVQNPATEQNNSRLGGTVSVPITQHQALKCSYNNGAYIKYGGDFQNITVGWQYSWLGRPN
jgi:hypothetical protein